MPPSSSPPSFPNHLRELREAAKLTRAQIVLRADQLAADAPTRYVTVSLGTIRGLEVIGYKPRATTAVTLAAVLNVSVEECFPLGEDSPIHNPQGNTRIPPDRKKGGRPRGR